MSFANTLNKENHISLMGKLFFLYWGGKVAREKSFPSSYRKKS